MINVIKVEAAGDFKSFTLESGKYTVCITIGVGEVRIFHVVTLNSAHKANKARKISSMGGRCFDSATQAILAYKAQEIRSMIGYAATEMGV